MKKAHEVTFDLWTYSTPVTVATDILARMREVYWLSQKRELWHRHKVRITVRAEIVKEPK